MTGVDASLMTDLQFGQFAAVGTAILWTFSALAWTAAGRRIGSLAVSFIRLPIACAMLAVYGLAVRGQPFPTDASPRAWLILGVSGFFGFFLSDVCLFKAFLMIGPRLALLILSLTPPMAAVLASLTLGDHLAIKDWGAMAVTLIGIGVVVLEQPEGGGQTWQRPVLGLVLAIVAAAAQAVSIVLLKEGMADCNDAAAATFIRGIVGVIGYIVLITAVGRWKPTLAALGDWRAMGTLSFGALVGPFVGVVLYAVALKYCSAGIVATITATMPVLILPFAVFLHHERVTLRAAIGAAISVAGVAWLAL